MSDELLHRTKDHPRDCVHGSQIGKCDTCDLDDAENQIKALELALAEAKQKVTELAAHNALLMQVSWEMKEGKPDAFYKIKDARNIRQMMPLLSSRAWKNAKQSQNSIPTLLTGQTVKM